MNAAERRLLQAWRSLPEGGRASLLDYAEFLLQRQTTAPVVDVVAQTPLDIPRLSEESVIKAVRRLNATYPMLANDHSILHEVSAQMTRHIIHGEKAECIIDQLELIFRQKYDVRSGTPPCTPTAS